MCSVGGEKSSLKSFAPTHIFTVINKRVHNQGFSRDFHGQSVTRKEETIDTKELTLLFPKQKLQERQIILPALPLQLRVHCFHFFK
jgi:hypothetical protein